MAIIKKVIKEQQKRKCPKKKYNMKTRNRDQRHLRQDYNTQKGNHPY